MPCESTTQCEQENSHGIRCNKFPFIPSVLEPESLRMVCELTNTVNRAQHRLFRHAPASGLTPAHC